MPTSVRVDELLSHLQGKGEEACREFYRALHLHVEEVYYSLPTRLRLRGESYVIDSHYAHYSGIVDLAHAVSHALVCLMTVSLFLVFPFSRSHRSTEI